MRWGIFILLGIFFVSFASAAISGACDTDMVAYWQFENNALDSYANVDGSWTSGTSVYSPFMVGLGSNFSGDDVISISNVPMSFTFAFTTEMWVQAGVFDVSSLFKKGNYKIEWVDVGADMGFVSVTIGDGVHQISISSVALNRLNPHHIAVVWASAGGVLRLYVDGNEEGSASLVSTGTVSGNIDVGDDGFVGMIDELAIYNSALSESVIDSHYSLGFVDKDYCDPSGAGWDSSTETLFNIGGCTFYIGDDLFGLAQGLCSKFPYGGEYFCTNDKEALVTDEYGLGCAMGDSDFSSGDNFCCPSGYFCNESEDGGLFKCDRRPVNCYDQYNEADCEVAGCTWLDIDGGVCTDGVGDSGCEIYSTSESCLEDEYHLGQVGIGTELCGTTMECNDEIFSISDEGCTCAWYDSAPAGRKCQVKLVGVQMIYNTGDIPYEFECSNAYELGNCMDGLQDVTWYSNNTILSGFPSGIPVECLDELNCNGGEGTRSCGEATIKLPGFSLFALFMSLFIVSMYYFVKEGKI